MPHPNIAVLEKIDKVVGEVQTVLITQMKKKDEVNDAI